MIRTGHRQTRCPDCLLLVIWIKDKPREAQFRTVVRTLLTEKIKPTPKVLQKHGFGNGRYLGGNLSMIRRDEFTLADWVEKDNGHWEPMSDPSRRFPEDLPR